MKKIKWIVSLFVLTLGIVDSSNAQNNPSPFIGKNYSRGEHLLVLRLAVSCPAEYTQQVGGVANASAYIDTWIKEINEMYGREFSVRFELIPNNDVLIFTNAATDPWPNKAAGGGCDGGPPLMNVQAQVIDNIIGAANYDFSHIFYSDAMSGGCAGAYKVGISGPPDFDITRHEMGHQFQQSHTINNPGNNNFEPENAGRSMQGGNSDPYAHSVSFHQLATHILFTETGVGTKVPTGNSIPTVNAGPDRVIPISTPFTLTATASDANNGDNLTYVWDQLDGGVMQSLPNIDDTQGALFSRLLPSSIAMRTYPKMTSIIANNYSNTEEHLPTRPRDINIRLTVNDNHRISYNGALVNASGINSDDMKIRVVNNGGPFQVNNPNTAVNYAGGSNQTISWAVNGTDQSPISTANVKISLSTDGGLTFPIVLANSTPNSGSAVVQVPNINTSKARIKVEAVGNIYFDISNQNFTITQNVGLPGIKIEITGANTLVSETGQTDTYNISLLSNPSGPVTVSLSTSAQLQVSLDGTLFGSNQSIVLTNTTPKVITIRGKYDTAEEGPHLGSITQIVTATADNANYPMGMPGEPITASISDAQIAPMVGVDFDEASSINVPNNWRHVSVNPTNSMPIVEQNISLEDGSPTNIDFTVYSSSCANGGCYIDNIGNCGQNLTPKHVQSLGNPNTNAQSLGFLMGLHVTQNNSIFSGEWSDLKPATKYRVFVFSFDLGTTEQTITIMGNGNDNPPPFLQKANCPGIINSEEPTPSRTMSSYGLEVTSTNLGTIAIQVAPANGGSRTLLAGFGIQEIFDVNSLCPASYDLSGSQSNSVKYETTGSISSTQKISEGATIDYDAATSISLNLGFEVKQGAEFHGYIDGCGNRLRAEPKESIARSGNVTNKINDLGTKLSFQDKTSNPIFEFDAYNCGQFYHSKEIILEKEVASSSRLVVYPNPTQQIAHITYTLNESQKAELYLMDFSGRVVSTISTSYLKEGKHYQKMEFSENLGAGLYLVVLKTATHIYTEKVIYQPY